MDEFFCHCKRFFSNMFSQNIKNRIGMCAYENILGEMLSNL